MITYDPFYKEVGRQQRSSRHSKFRREVAKRHEEEYGIKFARAIMFLNPIMFDVQGEAIDNKRAASFRRNGRRAVTGMFFMVGEN